MKRGSPLAELVERAGQRVGVVVGNLGDVSDERPVAVADGRDSRERGAVRVRAVVGVAPRDDHRALRLADERPVAAHDLRRRVNRLAAAAAEEHCRVRHGRESGEALRQFERGLVRLVAEDVVCRERAELLGDRIGDLGPAVADTREPEPGRRVDVLVSRPRPRSGSPRRGRARARGRRPCPWRQTDARACSSRRPPPSDKATANVM